jgi:hypothetical protein
MSVLDRVVTERCELRFDAASRRRGEYKHDRQGGPRPHASRRFSFASKFVLLRLSNDIFSQAVIAAPSCTRTRETKNQP